MMRRRLLEVLLWLLCRWRPFEGVVGWRPLHRRRAGGGGGDGGTASARRASARVPSALLPRPAAA